MPYIGRDLNRGNYLKLDDISSSFNGSTQTFNLTVGGSAFTPGSAFSILVSVGGVIQEPESAYQVNNSEITFANAPTAQDGFFCIALGVALGIGVPGNGTVNGAQIAKPFNYDGYFYLDDANNRVGIGSLQPKQALDIIGNTNITGILTAGTYSGPVSNASGISTFYDLKVTNNLTVEGTTTTLDTNLIGVDRIEVGANSNSVVGVAITQSGTADILNLYDGSNKEFSVVDGGTVKVSQSMAFQQSDRATTAGLLGRGSLLLAGTQQTDFAIRSVPHNSNLVLGVGVTERLRITSGGRVGIGSALPVTELDVRGNITIQNTYPSLFLFDTDHNDDFSIQNQNGLFAVRDETNSENRLTIDSNGNIGVNVTPKTSGTLYSTVDHFLVIGDDDTGIAQDGDGQFEIWSNDQEIANFNNNNIIFTKSIGIGSVTPAGSNFNSVHKPNVLAIGDSDTGIAQMGDGVLGLFTNNQERLRIDTSGRHLIGSPTSRFYAAKLQVQGTADSNYILMHNTSAGDADGNRYSKLIYSGTQSGGETSDLAHINASHDGTADDQKGRLEFRINTGAQNHSPVEALRIDSSCNMALGTITNAGNTLRYFDVGNYNTGSSAGSIIRLLTTKSDGTGAVGLDIVKYKSGGAYFNNYENIGTNGFISFGTAQNGGSVAESLRIKANGQVDIASNNYNSGHADTKLRVGTESGSNQATAVIGSADQNIPALTITNWDGAATTNKNVIRFDNSGRGTYEIGGVGGANAFAITIDTNEKVRIDSSGTVTINSTGNQTLYVNNTATNGQSSIAFQSAGTNQFILGSNKDGDGNRDFFIYDVPTGTHRFNITADGNIGIGEDNPLTGLSIGKYGTQPHLNGNTYPYPAGRWTSVWNKETANSTDYWCGFVGSYNRSSGSVNISLSPNIWNFSTQQGLYISGEATSTSTSDFIIGKIIGGNQAGASTSAGNQRATKSEMFRINSSGNITQTGSQYIIDSAASAEIILDRANTSSGATVSYKTGGTLKWYNGLRGLVNDDFYLRSEVANLDVLYIQTYGNTFHNCNSAGNPAGITIKNVNTNGYSHARIRLESQNNASYSNIYTDHPNTALRLEYNSSNSMYIKSDGKVGIKESTPAYTLESLDTGHTRHSIICSDNYSSGIYAQVMSGSSMTGNFTSRVDGNGTYDLYTGTSSGLLALRVEMGAGYNNIGRRIQINRQINLTGLDQNNLSDMLLARMIQAHDVARANGTSVVTNDSRTNTGIAIIRDTGNDNSTMFFGPYGYIEAGSYTAMFRMKTSVNTGTNPLVYIDVVGNGIANPRGRGNQRPRTRTLYPNNFTDTDQYQYFYLDFEVQNPPTGGSTNNYIETRALSHYPSRGNVSLDHILIVPRSVTYT